MPLDNIPSGSDNPALGKINEAIAFYTAHPDRWIGGARKDNRVCAQDLFTDIGAKDLLTNPVLAAAAQLGYRKKDGGVYENIPNFNDQEGFDAVMLVFEQVRLDLGGAPKTKKTDAAPAAQVQQQRVRELVDA
jgi:hypothetical protein